MRQILTDPQISPSQQIQTLLALSRDALRTDPSKAYLDAAAAYQQSLPLENGELKAQTSIHLGNIFYYLSRHDSSLHYFEQALNHYERIDAPDQLALIYNGIARAYKTLDNYRESRQYYALALGMRRRTNDSLGIATIFNNLGNNYKAEGQYYTALEYYRRAIEIYEDLGEQSRLASLLSNSAMLYGQLKDYSAAKQYLYGALEIQQAMGNARNVSIVLHNLGSIFSDQDSLDTALRYFLEVEQRLQASPFLSLSWENKIEWGAGLRKMGRADTALILHQSILPLLKSSGEKQREAHCLQNLALDLHELGRNEEALTVALEALTLADQIGAKPLKMDIYLSLSEIYPRLEQYREAYVYLENYLQLHDSLINEEKGHLLLQWKSQYERGKQQAEIDYLTEKTALQATHLERRNFLSAAMGIAVLGLLILGYLLYRRGQQQKTINEQLEQKVTVRTQELQSANQLLSQSNQELERFAYLTSHDLKEGVRNIVSFLQRLGQRLKYFPDEDAHTYYKFALGGGNHIHTVINGMEELKKLQAHTPKLVNEDINAIMAEVKIELQDQIQSKNAQLVWEKLPRLRTDPYLVKVMLFHLCHNGLTFNRSEIPWVNVSVQTHADQIALVVQDNGIGIDSAYQGQIFDLFQRLQKREEFPGVGLGLTFVRQAIEKLGGSVYVHSAPGTGSRFYLSFPTGSKSW